ncbi:ATP-binding protein [Candidatus Magnetomoraceae bacterium gMMP-1]
MRNIVGQAVSGDDFFDRPKEIKKLWKAISSGSHVLISAPRRVGKTSILFYLRDNPKKDYYFIYIITESINNENEFYKRIFKEIIESDFISRWEKFARNTSDFTRNILDKIKSFQGIELNKINFDYKESFINLLESLQINENLVIMLDEFPQTIENISNTEGEDSAVHFLQGNREIRHNTKIKNVQFIYTGSIGLENIVSNLNSINLINDLNSLIILPLSVKDAKKLIQNLLKDMDFNMYSEQIQYLLDKIEWFIPFYIQLFIYEIDNLCIDEDLTEITNATIDDAFDLMLKHRGYFEHWQIRLREAFKKQEYNFAEALLSQLSEKAEFSSNEILDMAVKHDVQADYKGIIRCLIHDGYINNNDDPGIYRFNSPILKTWWYRNVAC